MLGGKVVHRLRPYWLPFEIRAQNDGDHTFREGSTFEDVVRSIDLRAQWAHYYDSPLLPPAWTDVEVISFGQLSGWVLKLKHHRDRQAITRPFGLDERVFISFCGHWSSGDGAAEWSFEFKGTPEEATILRSFVEGQWRRGGEKSLDIKYKLTYAPPLTWSDEGEDWIRRLTRAGLSTRMATIGLELSGP